MSHYLTVVAVEQFILCLLNNYVELINLSHVHITSATNPVLSLSLSLSLGHYLVSMKSLSEPIPMM